MGQGESAMNGFRGGSLVKSGDGTTGQEKAAAGEKVNTSNRKNLNILDRLKNLIIAKTSFVFKKVLQKR